METKGMRKIERERCELARCTTSNKGKEAFLGRKDRSVQVM